MYKHITLMELLSLNVKIVYLNQSEESCHMAFVENCLQLLPHQRLLRKQSIVLTSLAVSSWLVTLTTGMSISCAHKEKVWPAFVCPPYVIGAAITKSSNSFYKSTWCLINMVKLLPRHEFQPDATTCQHVCLCLMCSLHGCIVYYVIVCNLISSGIQISKLDLICDS